MTTQQFDDVAIVLLQRESMKRKNRFLPEKPGPHANQSRKKLWKMHWGETIGFHGTPDPLQCHRTKFVHRDTGAEDPDTDMVNHWSDMYLLSR